MAAFLTPFTEDKAWMKTISKPTKSIPALSLVYPELSMKGGGTMSLINGAARLKLAMVSEHQFTKGSAMPLPDISLHLQYVCFAIALWTCWSHNLV